MGALKIEAEALLPPPSASLVVIRTGAQALVRTLGRRKGERFIREWMNLLSTEEAVRALLPARAPGDRAAVAQARSEALAWMQSIAPLLVAALPDE